MLGMVWPGGQLRPNLDTAFESEMQAKAPCVSSSQGSFVLHYVRRMLESFTYRAVQQL